MPQNEEEANVPYLLWFEGVKTNKYIWKTKLLLFANIRYDDNRNEPIYICAMVIPPLFSVA